MESSKVHIFHYKIFKKQTNYSKINAIAQRKSSNISKKFHSKTEYSYSDYIAFLQALKFKILKWIRNSAIRYQCLLYSTTLFYIKRKLESKLNI